MTDTAPPLAPEQQAALRRADAAFGAGELDAAIDAYRSVLDAAPDLAPAWSNLGVALRARGRLREARDAAQKAVALEPGSAAAQHQFARTLDALGQPMEALRYHFQAYRLPGSTPADSRRFRLALASALRPVRLTSASGPVVEILLDLFAADDLEHQELAGVTLALLGARPAFQAMLDAVGNPMALAPVVDGEDGQALLGDPLWLALGLQTLVADPEQERLVCGLRRLALMRAMSGDGPEWLLGPGPDTIAALACQATAAEHIWPQSATETREVAELGARLAAGKPVEPSPALLALALYRPVAGLAAPSDPRPLPDPPWRDPLATFRDRAIAAPSETAALGFALPALGTGSTDRVSAAVRAQYEENPYPRWLSVRRQIARPLPDVLRELFPKRFAGPGAADLPPESPTSVLVAGCGTGAHAVKVASRYAGAEVLAVDLSRAALGYAVRQAERLGLDNLRFAQGDILGLGAILDRFELIECSGVLHHMADPLAGWHILRELLVPYGVMKIGLYSTLARRDIAAARAWVAAEGFRSDAEGLRAARAAIAELPGDGDSAWAATVRAELDAYSASTLRDMLFNVQEMTFTIDELADALDALALEFLGFEGVAPPRDVRPPESLRDWGPLEEAHPMLFRAMYQFWCRPLD